MLEKSSLSSRFISAYNELDQALRNQGDMRKSISYTEAVHKASRTNAFVKKYEDELTDYGRLRNAIVHSSNENHVIAEPHVDVVEHLEWLVKVICTPPLAINTVCNKDVLVLQSNISVYKVMEYMYKTGHTNFPVYTDNMLVGVASAKRVIKFIGKTIYEKKDLDDTLLNTQIGSIVKEAYEDNYYTIASADVTVDKILSLFTENKKLAIVIVTKTGSLIEPPLGIVSTGDIMDINSVLEKY